MSSPHSPFPFLFLKLQNHKDLGVKPQQINALSGVVFVLWS